MEKKLLTRSYFTTQNIPKWRCPTCQSGVLISQGELTVWHTATTNKNRNEDWFEVDDIRGVFNGLLRCDNRSCSEHVVISGASGVERVMIDDEGNCEWVEFLTPLFFYPPLKLIDLPKCDTLPYELKQAIEASCLVFWSNLDACANRLRTAIELLLDHIGIIRQAETGRGKTLSLYDRITNIEKTELQDVKKLLHAIRLVGNDGSHDLDRAPRNDVISCYEILEHILELVFPPRSKTEYMLKIAQNLTDKRKR